MEFGFYPTAYRDSRCLSVLLCHLVTLDGVDASFVRCRVVNASVVHLCIIAFASHRHCRRKQVPLCPHRYRQHNRRYNHVRVMHQSHSRLDLIPVSSHTDTLVVVVVVVYCNNTQNSGSHTAGMTPCSSVYRRTSSSDCLKFGPLTAEIGPVVWASLPILTGFASWRRYCTTLQ